MAPRLFDAGRIIGGGDVATFRLYYDRSKPQHGVYEDVFARGGITLVDCPPLGAKLKETVHAPAPIPTPHSDACSVLPYSHPLIPQPLGRPLHTHTCLSHIFARVLLHTLATCVRRPTRCCSST